MKQILRAAALAGFSILLLTGCQSPKLRAMCPAVNVLANTASLTRFKDAMQGDPSGELFTIRVVSATTSCDVDTDEGTTDSSIEITFRATRAPSGDAANFTAPYYVASLLDGMTILDKKMLATAFTFAPGQSSVVFTETVPSTVIKFENGKKPYQYSLLVGLQLTREQLDYSKSHGRFAP